MFAAAAVAAGCERGIEEIPRPMPDVGEGEVEFAMPADATRTALEGDDRTTRWVIDDRIALWAQDNTSGEYVAEGVEFAINRFSPSYTKAYFRGKIAAQNEASEYTYYMCSPMPKSRVGTRVTYTLPAEQNGIYEGVRNGETYTTYDIMVAEPVVTGALTTGKEMELNTKFLHQMHALKITIPENRNLFEENGSSKFYELEIAFPAGCAVAGDITFDVANPDATPTYSNTSNVIRVTSNAGFDAGSEIWVFVLPGSVNGDIAYHVRGVRRRSEIANNALSKQLERGHVTPIKMRIPEIYSQYTAIHFSVDQNYLGEDFNTFDVYDANNNHMGTFERNASNKYSIDYEGEFDADQYDNTNWRIVFDSEHAIVEALVNLGDMTDYTEHYRSMNVPYLMYEDFATFPAVSNNDNYTGGSNATKTGAVELKSGSGWHGARCGVQAGTSARIASRRETSASYAARIDAPQLTGIKSGATVNVRVTYDYGANQEKGGLASSYNGFTVWQGYTTQTGGIASPGSGASPSGTYDDTNKFHIEADERDGSYTNLPHKDHSFTLSGVGNNVRVSWATVSDYNGGLNNNTQWLYIDNVRVQIIP